MYHWSHLISSDFISSELSAPWVVAATENWVASRRMAQFAVMSLICPVTRRYQWQNRWVNIRLKLITSAEEGGYVFSSACLSVCLSVCPSDYSQTCERILTKFSVGVGHGSRTKWYNFGGDPDHASDPGVQRPKSGSSGLPCSAEVCSLWVHLVEIVQLNSIKYFHFFHSQFIFVPLCKRHYLLTYCLLVQIHSFSSSTRVQWFRMSGMGRGFRAVMEMHVGLWKKIQPVCYLFSVWN